jgi:polyvinyl alcohol dehydrogenase (cytochrome)
MFANIARALAIMLAVTLMGADWPTYLHDPERTGGTEDTFLSPSNASSLTKLWSYQTGGSIAASPTVVGGTIYIGSWDGYEYALNAVTGSLKWKTYLGIGLGDAALGKYCAPMGVSSTATVTHGTVYVGGGRPFWYALSARTGRVLWRVRTGDELENGRYYNWSSPLVYKDAAYVGVASHCDQPFVPGQLLKVDLVTHRITRRFDVVSPGQVGGAIWTSPAFDRATRTVYVTTGNQGYLPAVDQPYARAVLALSTSLIVRAAWQLPEEEVQQADSDWGGTPTLFRDGRGRNLVAAVNKNGYVYAFDRSRLSAGPLWSRQIAYNDLNISSAAYGDGSLYVAGNRGAYNGETYAGSVWALAPATGAVKWFDPTRNGVLPALAYVNGLVIDCAGPAVEVRNAATGKLLIRLRTRKNLYGPASVADGRLFVGSPDGAVYAFAPATGAPTPPPTPPTPTLHH